MFDGGGGSSSGVRERCQSGPPISTACADDASPVRKIPFGNHDSAKTACNGQLVAVPMSELVSVVGWRPGVRMLVGADEEVGGGTADHEGDERARPSPTLAAKMAAVVRYWASKSLSVRYMAGEVMTSMRPPTRVASAA